MADRVYLDGVAWAVRANSKEKINAAGRSLLTLADDDPARVSALEIVNNWRSCHGYPLQIVKMTLLKRSRSINADATIAQRIKRLSSILAKLRDNPKMRLSQMQDIGGCRSVLESVDEVYMLSHVYAKSDAKNPTDRAVQITRDDYIKEPKPDGYRSLHMIYKYQSGSEKGKDFNGQQIEIQLRSQLQHAWATAVEISQTFTGYALKSKVKKASAEWLRFFALMGSAIAIREGCPLVPGTPTFGIAIRDELRYIQSKERIIEQLNAWKGVTRHYRAAPDMLRMHAFLLELDSEKRAVEIRAFAKHEQPFAEDEYAAREIATQGNPHIQVVLVGVDSIAALERAYPNYYLDTSVFISAVHETIDSP